MEFLAFAVLAILLAAFPGINRKVDGLLVSTPTLCVKPVTYKVSTATFPVFSLSAIGSSSNAGKGDDTIKELNKLDSIVIDPLLVTDPAFWDYCLVPNEQGPMQLVVLQTSSNGDCSIDDDDEDKDDFCGSLVGCGGDADDVAFYQETYEIFKEGLTAGPPTGDGRSGLVVRADTLESLPERVRSGFSKVIRVLRGEEESCVAEDDGDASGGGGGSVPADIEVSSLGELRALTICSYAYLTKRS